MKTCNKCGIEKDLSEFYASNNKKRGRQISPNCKPCDRKRVNKHRPEAKPKPLPSLLQGDQIWINDVMKISLVRGQKC